VETGVDGALWYLSRDGVIGRIVQLPLTAFIRNSPSTGVANSSLSFGLASDVAMFCDWDGNGTDTIGLYNATTGVWLLRNANAAFNRIGIRSGSANNDNSWEFDEVRFVDWVKQASKLPGEKM